MEARQSPPTAKAPDHYDIPTMIVIYTLVTLLGVGMCFCLRKANCLVPNKYSFPLALRRSYNRKQDDESNEDLRQGLLNDYSDQEDEDEEQRIGTSRGNQRRSLDRYHLEDDYEEDQGRELTDIQPSQHHHYSDNDDDDEFGALQEAPPIEAESSAPPTTKKPVVFVVDDEDEDDDNDENNKDKDIKKSI
ncbi:unnamed protein product [Cunninghamella blakesleeana]